MQNSVIYCQGSNCLSVQGNAARLVAAAMVLALICYAIYLAGKAYSIVNA